MSSWAETIGSIAKTECDIVGYIDRPLTTSVINMLCASTDTFGQIGDYVTDRQLFAHVLKSGERSAVFSNVSKANTFTYGLGREEKGSLRILCDTAMRVRKSWTHIHKRVTLSSSLYLYMG